MATSIDDITGRRALHWVLKIADRKVNIDFFRSVLCMKMLRHEEFEKGCDAACNGPYDGKWSKTMIGYGPEANHFVLELTYNYNVGSYDYRHDFCGITIESPQVFEHIVRSGYAKQDSVQADDGIKRLSLTSPDGYPFFVTSKISAQELRSEADPVRRISLSVSNLDVSLKFWSNVLNLQTVDTKNDEINDQKSATLAYPSIQEQPQCELELVQMHASSSEKPKTIEHGSAFGRIAFACPQAQLAGIESQVKSVSNESGSTGKVITPLLSLDTPGKATVQVVILGDSDGYEICFVGSEAFDQLGEVDPNADRLLDEAMQADKSSAWYTKKKVPKPAAKA